MRVFLGGGMVGLTEEEKHGWRDEATTMLASYGIGVFNPCEAYYQNPTAPPWLVAFGNVLGMTEVDLLLAYIPDEKARPYWGLAMEIVWARQMQKPIVMVGECPPEHPYLKFHVTEWFPTLQEAVDWIGSRYEYLH